MKKFLFIIAMFATFGSLKAEEKLTSESFEISELVNELSGFYLNHMRLEDYSGKGLKAHWKIRNISQSPVTFKATLEKISMGSSHILANCIGDECKFQSESQLPAFWTAPNKTYGPGDSSKPLIDSYLEMFSGKDSSDAMPKIDTLRVSYWNVDSEEDYVTFLCIWDFTNSSIEIIEDISDKICPNPTSEQLNLIWDENNINEIEFFDINGSKLLSKDVTNLSEVNVDISSLNAGVYVGYFVKSGKRVKVFRFVKN